MRFEYWLIVVATLGGLVNLWIISDAKRINADPDSLIIVENYEVHYGFVAIAVWLDILMLIKIYWL
jgi:hypothetical protein